MKNLEGFSVPEKGEVTLCEVDGRLHSMKYEYANINAFTNSVDRHPKIQITRDMLHALSTGDEGRTLFLPVHESFFKQVANTWYEQGFTEALRLISTEKRNESKLIAQSAKVTLKIIDFFSQIYNVFQPYTHQDRKNLIATFSQTRNWLNSPIRCIAWHPHCTKLAVAACDDSIRIYTPDSSLVPILKSKLQRNISCIAWRPLSASELAVACESCCLIWTLDPNSVVTRPSTANSYVLRRVHHWPVASLAWSPRGELLVSASPMDGTLLVWDVALDQTCALKRASTAGNALVSWAPGVGARLVAATTNLVFRVWECRNWSAERWTTSSGRIQSACWSPCGSVLLFATCDEPILYALTFSADTTTSSQSLFTSNTTRTTSFTTHDVSSPQQAIPVLDLVRTELNAADGQLFGGLVQTIEWEPKGRHLAIMFRDTDYIAVFTTTCRPTLQITPSCVICGMPGEFPCTISFQKNFEDGACLSIAWSSGRLQHFPLVYSDTRMQQSTYDFKQYDNNEMSYNSFTRY